MARILMSGAELGEEVAEHMNTSTIATISSEVVRSGNLAWRCSGTSGTAQSALTSLAAPPLNVRQYARAYFRFSALPTALVGVLTYGASTTGVGARLNTDGKLRLYASNAQVGSDSVVTLQPNTWYRIELMVMLTAGNDECELRLDGVTVASSAVVSFGISTPARFGWHTAPGDPEVIVYVDDIAINDDTGADQNSWPGEGNLVVLLPIADSFRGARWTGGAGGTTNLFDALNNIPPVGVAAETDTSQIEHLGTTVIDTDDNYEPVMATYSSAGIGSSDTISVILPVAAVGEETNSDLVTLELSVLSNPAIATLGSFDGNPNNLTVGTFPTGWFIRRDRVSYAPTVVLGTSPIMRIRRTAASEGNDAAACLMAIYIDYLAAGVSTALKDVIGTGIVPFAR